MRRAPQHYLTPCLALRVSNIAGRFLLRFQFDSLGRLLSFRGGGGSLRGGQPSGLAGFFGFPCGVLDRQSGVLDRARRFAFGNAGLPGDACGQAGRPLFDGDRIIVRRAGSKLLQRRLLGFRGRVQTLFPVTAFEGASGIVAGGSSYE